MTREEAIKYLEGWHLDNCTDGQFVDIRANVGNMRKAIAALRGPIPDPETGLVPCGCNWCGQERIGWFSVQFWVRACYGKRKWMSVTQDWKKKVKYCPMCGRKLEVEG